MVLGKLIWLGIGLAAIFWIADSFVHALVFGQGGAVRHVVAPEPIDVWMRSVVLVLLMTLGGYAQYTVSKWKRAEEALRLRGTALEAAANAIVITDREARIEWVNPAFTRLTGYASEEVLGQNPRIFKSGKQDEPFYEHLWETILSGQVWHGEIINRRKDGSLYTEEMIVAPVCDERGEITHFIAIKQDITERKRMEEALREQARDLGERVKELSCLYGISHLREQPDTPLEEILQGVADLIPPGWQYPEITCGRVILEGQEYRTENFQETVWKQASDIIVDGNRVGTVEVYYLEERPEIDEGPFLKEERSLIAAIAERVGRITERKRAEEALRLAKERLQHLVSASPAVIYSAMASDDYGATFISENVTAQMGYEPREFVQDSQFWASHIHPEDAARALADLQHVFQEGQHAYEYRFLHKDGTYRWMHDEMRLIRDADGNPLEMVGCWTDITERKRMEEALREQARRDLLTGMLNHGAIVEELRNLISSRDGGAPFAVAMVDVDGLKAINDTYGHQVGDAVLVAVARGLPRDGALVGRYGGDEFVVVLPGADPEAAERYRHAVLNELAHIGLTDPETGASVPVAASVGLAVYPQEAETIADLIRLADSAMYASKRQRPVGSKRLPRPLGSDRAKAMVGEIVPLLTSPGGLDDKLRLVAQRISMGAGYDAVNIDIFSEPGGPPSARNTFSEVPDEVTEAWLAERRRMDGDPFAQLLLRTRRGVIVDDPQNDERLTETQRTVLRAAELRSAVVVPLFWVDELIGILSAASKREAAFKPQDVQFLTTVATQVTAIVRMATLVDELQSTSDRLAQAQTGTVMLLAAVAEAHDRTTGLHLQGVRTLTEALACELGHSEEDVKELGLAAVLHDIGKIRVPDSILTSTGPLPGEAWELMKQHTTWGGELLAGRPDFELAAAIARSHHERWDGSGYPDGLSGEAIPEAAAIVAIADSFDAMIHDRPYRAGRPVDRAMREIAAWSGKQFSPKVVAALERLVQRNALSLAPTWARDQQAAA